MHTEQQPSSSASLLDMCRRACLTLPLAHLVNDIPMRAPAERLARVVALLEESIAMTEGSAMDFRQQIKQGGVAAALSEQFALRRAGNCHFVAALSEEVDRNALRNKEGAG